ncbi:mechanosensitive ion channel [Enterococcus sp. 669A]|uniref:Mechanosensitive ion channel n=1 Tax=Candidatus Enterococcus moelleringii TaxID=2815325 RepID=A0ABS3LE13_9ENTE|nr:mechanosensitive ion channel domain-containing protein [Enterococcus sp. 669A]MBO1307859.1 mechanosensitive ion channel [Enterococcus sp. 669A]
MDQSLNTFFQNLAEDIQGNINDSRDLTGKVVLSVGLVLLLILSERLVRFVVRHLVDNLKAINVLTSVSAYFLRIASALLLVRIWVNALDFLLVILLVIGGFALLSLKGLFANLVGWFLIINKHPFRVYDRIEIDGVKGEVMKIRPFYFVMMELSNWFDAESPTGRTVRIPNKQVLEEPLFNYNELTPYIWKEIKYLLTYQSDWEAALEIMETETNAYYQEFLRQNFENETQRQAAFKEFELFDGDPDPVTIMDVQDRGIEVKIRYLVFYKDGTAVQTQLHQKILKNFQANPQIQLVGNTIAIEKTE